MQDIESDSVKPVFIHNDWPMPKLENNLFWVWDFFTAGAI